MAIFFLKGEQNKSVDTTDFFYFFIDIKYTNSKYWGILL